MARPVVFVKLLHPLAQLPAKGTPMSAGFDLIAAIDEPVRIIYGQPAILVPTGVAIHIADPNIMAALAPRSGLGHKVGLVLGNTVGVIDPDFQNQWMVSCWNRGNGVGPDGNVPDIVVNPGDRIAQAIFVPILDPEFKVVEEFDEATERGLGGFGHTGVDASRTAL